MEGITTTIAVQHRPHGLPVAAVIGELHVVMRGESVIEPMQNHTSELAGLLKIERQHLLSARGRSALPGSGECSVKRVRGLRPRLSRGRLQHGRGVARRLRRQLAKADLIETYRAAATTPGLEHELERRAVFESAIVCGSPGELDLSFLDLDPLPLTWDCKITVVDPPDILAACIDELEFQVVRRCVAAYVERELVIGWKVDRQGTTRDSIARDARKVEIEAQRLPFETCDCVDRRPDAIRGVSLP